MAKKKRVLYSETIHIHRFGSGFTFEGSRWYEKEPHDEFKEIYTDRMELMKGLAKYLRLGVAREERSRFPGMLSIFEIPGSDEKLA